MYIMKVKDVIEFLSNCNPDADFLYEDEDGNDYELDELCSGNFTHFDDKTDLRISTDCVYAFFKDNIFR